MMLLFRSRRIDVRSHWGFLREREFRGLSSIFGAARKYCSGWIGQVILIWWKCSVTLTVKLNYAPNKNTSFFLLQALRQLLQVHRMISNNKTPASQSPTEVMFARRIPSVYDKLLPKQTKPGRTCIVPQKRSNPGDKVFFQNLQRQQIILGYGNDRKKNWEHDIHYKGSTIYS